ncbi:MAG: hypothetical protein JNM60_06035 [Candidatus Competibacteraceae bacterium]|nr:hypothetical protein [Candidatus Competibacteraceae bacterium]
MNRAPAATPSPGERETLIGDVRGRCPLPDVERVADRAAKTPARAAAEAVPHRSLARGPSFKISLGNALTRSAPPIVSEREMDSALDSLESAIADTERDKAG